MRTLRVARLVAGQPGKPIDEVKEFPHPPSCPEYALQQAGCPRPLALLCPPACPALADLVGVLSHVMASSAGPSAECERVSPPARGTERPSLSLMLAPRGRPGGRRPAAAAGAAWGVGVRGETPPRIGKPILSTAILFRTGPKPGIPMTVR